MKKIIYFILALIMCLSLCACGKSDVCSCDCVQCAQCEEKTQNTVAADADQVDNVSEEAEQNENVIEFETPIVVAEDQYLRVELVKFYQEYTSWTDRGQPSSQKADSTTEGATLEKFVVFKLCNKTDHALTVYINDVYLGSDGADSFDIYNPSRIDTAAGKNVLRAFLIQTGANEALASMDELYSLDGDFSIFHKGEDGVMRDNYRLKFSIPNALDSGATPVSNNSDAWNQFRDYLKEQGPVTVVTNHEYGQNKITIKENEGTIQISRVSEGTIVSGKVRFHELDTMRFELPSNAKTVSVHEEFLQEGSDENGKPREQSGSTSHTWDIQNYHHGDEVSFTMDYSELDTNGKYIQKTGTMTATGAYAEVSDALSKTLAESGLDVTMADLGFVNY